MPSLPHWTTSLRKKYTLPPFKKNYYILLIVCMCVYDYACPCEGQRVTGRSQFSPSTLWDFRLGGNSLHSLSHLDSPLPPSSYFLVRCVVTETRKESKTALLWMEPQQSPKCPCLDPLLRAVKCLPVKQGVGPYGKMPTRHKETSNHSWVLLCFLTLWEACHPTPK